MKTTVITTEPDAPINRLAAMILINAIAESAKQIVFRIDEPRVTYDGQAAYLMPPAEVMPYMYIPFLKYAGIKKWPWTRSVKAKMFSTVFDNIKTTWMMTSPDIHREFVITRIEEKNPDHSPPDGRSQAPHP